MVTGEETELTGDDSARATKRNRALATVVLSVDTSLLYLIGDPVRPSSRLEEAGRSVLRKRHGQHGWTYAVSAIERWRFCSRTYQIYDRNL